MSIAVNRISQDEAQRQGAGMVSKMISVIVVVALLHANTAAQDQPQSAQQTTAKKQQILRKAQEKDKAVKIALNKKINNQNRLTGKVIE